MQILSSALYYAIILVSTVLYIGMCLYLNVMVRDLKLRLQAINASIFADEIAFHSGVLE